MTDDKNKRIAYDFMSEKYDMPSFEQFSKDIEDEDNRRMLFDIMSEKYDMPDFKQFSKDLIGYTPEETYRQAQPAAATYDYRGALPTAKQPAQAATAPKAQQQEEKPKEQRATQPQMQPTMQAQMSVKEAAQGTDTMAGIQRLSEMRQSLLQKPDTLKQMEVNRKRDTMLAVVNNDADALERLRAESEAKAQAQAQKEQTREEVADLGKTIEEGMAAESRRLRAENSGNTPLDKLADKDTPWWQKIGYSLYAGEHPTQFTVDSPDMKMWRAAEHKLKESQRMIAEADHNAAKGTLGKWLEQSFAGGVARGFGQHVGDVSTWDFGISDVLDNAAFMKVLDKADRGEALSQSEQALLDASTVEYLTNQYFGSEVGRGYKAGSVTAESLPFMLEMIINPMAGVGKGVQAKMTRYAMKRFGDAAAKGGAKHVTARALELGGRVVGDIAGAAGMAATTGAGRVTADAIDRMNTATLNGEEAEWGEAWRKAFAGTTIENYSEMFGAYFAPVLGAAGNGMTKAATSKLGSKIGLAKVHDFVQNVKASDVAKAVADFEQHAQWNGMIGEYAEEVAGGIMNALVVGDLTLDRDPETGVFNLDNNIDTFLGVALMGGVMSAVKTAGYRTPKYQARQAMRAADMEALHAFGDDAELWGGVRDVLANGNVEEVKGKLDEILTNPDYSAEQKHAALNYVHKATAYKGVLNGEQKRRVEGEVDEQQLAHEDAYDRGYEADEEEQRKIAVEAAAGGEEATEARAALEGVRQRIEDNATEEADTERSEMRKKMHKDGHVRRAVLKELDDNGNNLEVYIVDGNVAMSADGTAVDREQSDSSVVVYDPTTGKRRMIDPANDLGVLSLDAAVSADEVEAQIEQSRQQQVQERLDAASGKVNVEVGQVVQVPGTEMQGTVVAISEDGEGLTVQTAEGEQVPVLRSDLQRMADESTMADYEQRRAEEEADTEEQVAAEEAAAEAETEQPFMTGQPDSYEAGMEVGITNDNGDVEVVTMTGKRYRYEGGELVEDNENGRILEYIDANGNVVHENVAGLNTMVSGYRMPIAEENTEAAIEPIGTSNFGYVYDQFRGKPQEAVEFLIKMQSGEALGALHHKDVGDISLVWGNENSGLEKIAKKHPEVLGNLQGIIDGMHVVQSSDNRIKLESDTHFAVISRDWLGKEHSPWLLTAYEKRSSATNNTMDTADTSEGKPNDTATRQNTASYSDGKDTNISETGRENVENNEHLTSAVEAMPMIGEGEEAEPDFMATSPERSHTYIYNEAGLSAEEADAFVKNNQAAAEKALATLQKKAPKMGTSLAQYNKAKAEHEAKVAQAQAQVDYWNGVADVHRKAEADRMMAELEAREAERKAQEAQEAAAHEAALARLRSQATSRSRA